MVFGVPVCAPYSTLNNYKYRCKLVPGTLKKGKAVKTVMSVFLSQKDLPEFEKKLMKSMNEPELVNAMIGNVKIGAAGMNHLNPLMYLINYRFTKGKGEGKES